MNVLTSTFILTVLLAIGLFFFIRASTKARIEQMTLVSSESEAVLIPRLEAYFVDRAYKIAAVDRETDIITFEGFVSPSIFLTILLSSMAAIGAVCLALVLSMQFPDIGNVFLVLLIAAPLAGWFYWQGSARTEQVRLKVDAIDDPATTVIKISGHRDELAIFKSTLKLSAQEELNLSALK